MVYQFAINVIAANSLFALALPTLLADNLALRRIADTDSLTQAASRPHLEQRIRLDILRCRMHRDALTVILFDIDHFKRINDEYGHAAGDAVLRQLADLMCEGQRKIDMLGRIGGEEFALLLPGTELTAATVFAERLRQRVEQTPMRLDDGVTLNITVSIGIAAMDEKAPGGDQALIRADQALYRAKRAGRNRVEQMDGEADRPGHQVPAASGLNLD